MPSFIVAICSNWLTTPCNRGMLSFIINYGYSYRCDIMERCNPLARRTKSQRLTFDRQLTQREGFIRNQQKTASKYCQNPLKWIAFIFKIITAFGSIEYPNSTQLVNLFVDFALVLTRKKNQRNNKFLSDLREPNTYFMIGQNNHEAKSKLEQKRCNKILLQIIKISQIRLLTFKWKYIQLERVLLTECILK